MRFTSRMVVPAVVGIGALVAVSGLNQPGRWSPTAATAQVGGPSAAAVLRTVAGDEVGRATFTPENGQVVVDISASGLPPGFHGFHVHAAAQCAGPDFTSAGTHFNPMAMTHPMHAGDLPSLLVNDDGMAELRATTDRFSVEDLLAGSGTALIVHASPDNFANIPTRYVPAPDATTLGTGDAGARIACGVIQPA